MMNMKQGLLDGINLDPENELFYKAAEFVECTDNNLYITGKAGTGKTTLLRYIHKTTKKKHVILAPTALAAVNANGQTIHSFFRIDWQHLFVPGDRWLSTDSVEGEPNVYERFKYNKDKQDLIKELELIIIDEISMVRCELIDVIDRLLRIFRSDDRVFGGVQMVFIGDVFQLPPVTKNDVWEILGHYYESPFFFSAKALAIHKPYYIELDKIYRQKEEDFISILNRIRVGMVTLKDIKYLNSRVENLTNTDGYIILGTKNDFVDYENKLKLDKLEGDVVEYEADIDGIFKGEPSPKLLQLKKGAQIVFVKNDDEGKYYNGLIGVIEQLDEDTIVINANNKEIKVERVSWNNIEYTVESEKLPEGSVRRNVVANIIGTYTQFPIKLGWAMTIHKSQGQTFDKVIADVGGAFAEGQAYVALSRCTTLNGLILKKSIQLNDIKVSKSVIKFAKGITPLDKLQEAIDSGKADC